MRPALAVCLLLLACGPRPPRLAVGPLARGLDAYLAQHPLAPEQSIRVDEVARTDTASWHLVQVRDREAPHRHARHDLAVVVVRGEGTLTLDGGRIPMGAGDVAVIPRDAVHWFANGERQPAVALVAFTPPLDAPDVVPADPVDSQPGRR